MPTLQQALAICLLLAAGAGIHRQLQPTASPLQGPAVNLQQTPGFTMSDDSGRRKMTCGPVGDAAGLWFYDNRGGARLNAGVYDDGLPFVVLVDKRNEAAAILRLVGPHDAPALVFKAKGRDRMVLGLSFDGDYKPFMATIDETGKQTDILGHFTAPETR